MERMYRYAAARIVRQLIEENRKLRQRTSAGPTVLAAFFCWLESQRVESENQELRLRLAGR